MHLFIVRHGETEWNKDGFVQGCTDIELNDKGREQAKLAREKIDLDNIDVVFCSPLKRARETAEIITDGKFDLIVDDDLRERGFGKLEGTKLSFEKVVETWQYDVDDNPDGMETVKECLERSKRFLDRIKKEYKDKNVLVVSHGCTIKTMHFNIVGYDENTDFMSFWVDNGVVYDYEI